MPTGSDYLRRPPSEMTPNEIAGARKSFGRMLPPPRQHDMNQPSKPKEEESKPKPKPSDGKGGSRPDPFASARSVELPSRQDHLDAMNQAIQQGQSFLEALGHEDFRDLVSSAMAMKFDVPDELGSLLSGEDTQPITTGLSQNPFDPSTIGIPARQALQRGISTLPPAGGGSNNA